MINLRRVILAITIFTIGISTAATASPAYAAGPSNIEPPAYNTMWAYGYYTGSKGQAEFGYYSIAWRYNAQGVAGWVDGCQPGCGELMSINGMLFSPTKTGRIVGGTREYASSQDQYTVIETWEGTPIVFSVIMTLSDTPNHIPLKLETAFVQLVIPGYPMPPNMSLR